MQNLKLEGNISYESESKEFNLERSVFNLLFKIALLDERSGFSIGDTIYFFAKKSEKKVENTVFANHSDFNENEYQKIFEMKTPKIGNELIELHQENFTNALKIAQNIREFCNDANAG